MRVQNKSAVLKKKKKFLGNDRIHAATLMPMKKAENSVLLSSNFRK